MSSSAEYIELATASIPESCIGCELASKAACEAGNFAYSKTVPEDILRSWVKVIIARHCTGHQEPECHYEDRQELGVVESMGALTVHLHDVSVGRVYGMSQ